MLAASPGLALARRERRRLGHRWSSGWVSDLRLRCGASLSECLLGGCGLFSKRCSLIVTLFSLGNSTGASSGLLIEIVLLGCLSGDLVVRMIPFDLVFVPLCRFLGRFGSCKVGYRVNHWMSVIQHVMYRQWAN